MVSIQPPAAARIRLLTAVRLVALGLAAVLLGGVVGCASITQIQPGGLADAEQIAATCPAGHLIAARAAIDVGANLRAVAGEAGRLDPVRKLVRLTEICGGHLRVDAFAGSAGSTAAVYDGDLALGGATQNARLRREPRQSDEVMAAIMKNLPIAAAKLPPEGSDIITQLGTMAAEYGQGLDPAGSRYVLHEVITTDGVQTERVPLTDPSLTVARAEVLAAGVAMPSLAGADVQLTSIGKTAGPAPATSYSDALKAFYRKLCDAARAARCVVVTDGAGR
ncbi:hypothetical protein ACQP1G_37055 [Nocardia sp. CA-107356]|uniref:hypothetical protein n=1 Tax=Nocardia sp. CA-107356 TaxID=3239972 RepID=UPI003D903627